MARNERASFCAAKPGTDGRRIDEDERQFTRPAPPKNKPRRSGVCSCSSGNAGRVWLNEASYGSEQVAVSLSHEVSALPGVFGVKVVVPALIAVGSVPPVQAAAV